MDTLDYLWIIIIVMPTVFLIIFGYIIYISVRRMRVLKEVFKSQAEKRNVVYEKKLLGSQSFIFPYKDTEIKVLFVPGGKYSPPHIFVKANLNFSINEELYIFSESLTTRISKRLTGQDIEIGDNRFDNDFIVKSTSQFFANKILGFNIRDKLISLLKYKPRLFVGNNSIELDIPTLLNENSEYDDIIDIVLKLYDQVNYDEFKKDTSRTESFESEIYHSEKRKRGRNTKIFSIVITLIVIFLLLFIHFGDFNFLNRENKWDENAIHVTDIVDNPDLYLNTTQKVKGSYWPDWVITDDDMLFGITTLGSMKIRFNDIDTSQLIKGEYYYFTGYIYQPVNESYICILVSEIEPIDWLNEEI